MLGCALKGKKLLTFYIYLILFKIDKIETYRLYIYIRTFFLHAYTTVLFQPSFETEEKCVYRVNTQNVPSEKSNFIIPIRKSQYPLIYNIKHPALHARVADCNNAGVQEK